MSVDFTKGMKIKLVPKDEVDKDSSYLHDYTYLLDILIDEGKEDQPMIIISDGALKATLDNTRLVRLNTETRLYDWWIDVKHIVPAKIKKGGE